MKAFRRSALVVFSIFLFGCQQQQQRALTAADEDAIKKEVADQFHHLVADVNRKDAYAWSENYSRDEFVSAIVMTDYFATRKAWVDRITDHFSTREYQHLEPVAVRVRVLGPDLALLTSEEKGVIRLKGGKDVRSKHVFTMIWRKQHAAWKIIHSHESWVDE